jgi:hypothetical protein
MIDLVTELVFALSDSDSDWVMMDQIYNGA